MSKAALLQKADGSLELGELTSSIGFLLRIAQIRVFDAFYQTLAQEGLKPGEFTVLWLISLNPDQRQGTIAQTLAIKPAHMTKLVQRLVDRELIARNFPADDRRSVYLSLTDTGEAFVAEHKDQFLNFHKTERGRLTTQESRQLCQLLLKFTNMTD